MTQIVDRYTSDSEDKDMVRFINMKAMPDVEPSSDEMSGGNDLKERILFRYFRNENAHADHQE